MPASVTTLTPEGLICYMEHTEMLIMPKHYPEKGTICLSLQQEYSILPGRRGYIGIGVLFLQCDI